MAVVMICDGCDELMVKSGDNLAFSITEPEEVYGLINTADNEGWVKLGKSWYCKDCMKKQILNK